jgi:pentatricopeptide repeat protein
MQKRRRVPIVAFAVSALAWGCWESDGVKEAPRQGVTAPAAELSQSGAPASPPPEFDLGGPCLERDPRRRLPNGFLQEQELRKAGDWEQLIESMKELVRDNCDISFRWGGLFKALADGGRSAEALQVANEMTRRGFPPPQAFISKTDVKFRESGEFRTSSLGKEYARRDGEIQQILKRAEETLAGMGKDLPPNIYRSLGACPFECCTYRKWKTEKVVRLQESIGSTTIVSEIPAGADVTGVTGEVHVEPEPYAVLENNGILKAGEVDIFLDYEGEGYVSYWYKGKIKPELGLDDGLTSYTDDQCLPGRRKGACSLRKMRPGKKFLNEWWVKLRTSEGKEGWVLNTGQFTNVDRCG